LRARSLPGGRPTSPPLSPAWSSRICALQINILAFHPFSFYAGNFLQILAFGWGLRKLVLCSHMDHIGALPYFTEVCGYHGPIYMTVSYEHMIIVCVTMANENCINKSCFTKI
jgi:hypothetical protein